MKIAKYHGCGNDFIIMKYDECYVNDYANLAIKLCDRHTGAGGDGLIIVKDNPWEMLIYNSDGSQAPMCGNGIRCFAMYCYRENLWNKKEYEVATLAGLQHVHIISFQPFLVNVNMGIPDVSPERINTVLNKPIADFLISVEGSLYYISSLFLGTVHTVLFTNHLDTMNHEIIGRTLCEHEMFKEKTNVNMVEVINRETILVKTYERGVGMTLACGSGCSASAYMAYKKGLCDSSVKVILEKGSLMITILKDESVMMCGPAECVFEGVFVNIKEGE